MAGLEAANEPLEEAASHLSLDSLRDHKKHTLLFEFFKGEMHLPQGICLTNNSLWNLMTYQLLLPVNRRYYLLCNDNTKSLL